MEFWNLAQIVDLPWASVKPFVKTSDFDQNSFHQLQIFNYAFNVFLGGENG